MGELRHEVRSSFSNEVKELASLHQDKRDVYSSHDWILDLEVFGWALQRFLHGFLYGFCRSPFTHSSLVSSGRASLSEGDRGLPFFSFIVARGVLAEP